MLDQAGPHFALSELAIVIASVYCAARLCGSRLWLAAAGSILFGVIAAVGAIRFGTGKIDAMAEIHRAFSLSGGAAAMSLIAAQLVLLSRPARTVVSRSIAGALLASAIAALLMPSASMVLFLIWLVIAISAAAFLPSSHSGIRFKRALIVGIFAFNIALIRQSPLLGPGLSWHLFHLLVAIWLVGILWVFSDHDKTALVSGTQ